ncbi:MAG: S8 family serine peptidase [Chitinophagales bacterium]
MRKLLLLIGFFSALSVQAQNANETGRFWVYFSDKGHTPYSIQQPHAYLSDRSIERREKMHIPIRYSDLPVDPHYVVAVEALGAEVVMQSRWFNALSVRVPDSSTLQAIQALSFVQKVKPVMRYAFAPEVGEPFDNSLMRSSEVPGTEYGRSWNQIHMLNLDFLHEKGFRGEGMVIAVLDGGFYAVDTGEAFQSFWDKGQILGVHNFPDDNEHVFDFSTHGANVLSIMGGDIPGVFSGSAPDASFYLYRTEIVDSETVAEEDYWLEGAEMADFVGADIINSSLGYTTFDGGIGDHTYADMDGNTTVVTNAADMAAAVGILVCNSAGNEGDSEWHFIGAPADGDSVFTIGAVDLNGHYAGFSSQGPTFDGRIKPNVAAQGAGTAYLEQSGLVYNGNGTSYSSPMMAGASACFWQAFPELSNMAVIEKIQESASRASNPDYLIGYGIPDFTRAYLEMEGITISGNTMQVYPNPATDHCSVLITGNDNADATLRLFDAAGKLVYIHTFRMEDEHLHLVEISGLNTMSSGLYFFSLQSENYTESLPLMVKWQ